MADDEVTLLMLHLEHVLVLAWFTYRPKHIMLIYLHDAVICLVFVMLQAVT